jgi:hypothetical protein
MPPFAPNGRTGDRDAVLRTGLESTFRCNEYDGIEDEIAKLPRLSAIDAGSRT